MGMFDWAKHEIELAKQFERKDSDNNEDEFDYGCACYDSALKAYNALLEDGHSGMSISITKNILNRLIDENCFVRSLMKTLKIQKIIFGPVLIMNHLIIQTTLKPN